ncbi:hypothetical protein, partial [Paenibacillus graminis]|uniref:hypothetical protein n=1 Tax=Paenibacillus graminis TaxID=189425 RepID=UPI001EE2BBD8
FTSHFTISPVSAEFKSTFTPHSPTSAYVHRTLSANFRTQKAPAANGESLQKRLFRFIIYHSIHLPFSPTCPSFNLSIH